MCAVICLTFKIFARCGWRLGTPPYPNVLEARQEHRNLEPARLLFRLLEVDKQEVERDKCCKLTRKPQFVKLD